MQKNIVCGGSLLHISEKSVTFAQFFVGKSVIIHKIFVGKSVAIYKIFV
jgi:hypothetical protein